MIKRDEKCEKMQILHSFCCEIWQKIQSMEESLQNIDIRAFKDVLPSKMTSTIGNDFIICDVTYDENLEDLLPYPCRFNGYLAMMCIKGEVNLDINLHTFSLKSHSFLFTTPGAIIKLSDHQNVEQDKDAFHFLIVALSPDFMSSIHIDFNRLYNDASAFLDNPCIEMDSQEMAICGQYVGLIDMLINSEQMNKRDSIGSLCASFLYVLGSFCQKRVSEARMTSRQSVRSKAVFDQFLRLVTEFHSSQRGMAFYAERLCLSPKYLSKLIKNVSGRSAPDWIDSFVILEAKNLLKYSDLTIKEIVYKLHFPNQSVFYKFFKNHTGMTPSEYRNS